VEGSRGRSLEGEPFFKAGATEGMQTVEEGERLVEEIGADLQLRREMLVGMPLI
jgi:hypothetical protein